MVTRVKSTHLVETQSFSLAHLIGLIAMAVGFIAAAIYMPQSAWVGFHEEYLNPLRSGEPVVRVDYGNFAAGGVVWGGLGVPALAVLAIIHRYFGLSDRARRYVAKGVSVWAVIGLFLAVLVPMGLGKLAEYRVEQTGAYQYCNRLVEIGFIRYRTVYVADPRLCVSPYALEETLARYGYARPDH